MDTNTPEVTESTVFLAMWDNTGLECLVDLTQHFKKQTWAALAGDKIPADPVNLEVLKLRAMYNSQREYEIYSFNTSPSVTQSSIKEWFENDPQSIVDWIREHGNKIYSDYNKHSKSPPRIR
jgi:hypothetical protein